MATNLNEQLKKDQQLSTQLNDYAAAAQTYKPSTSVTEANSYLEQVKAGKPANYESGYSDNLQSIYDQMMNRGPFNYDLNGDALYQQYKENYQRMGKKAAQETAGAVSALSGGYGSSYAVDASQQAYQDYLSKLNAAAPQLMQNAYEQYAAEGDNLANMFRMTQSADEAAYSRYQDQLQNWQADRAYAQAAANNAYQQDYQQYTDSLNRGMDLMQMSREDAMKDREESYNLAVKMIKAGALPTSDLLYRAGITDADALALAKKFGYRAGGSGGKKKSGDKNPTVTGGSSYGSYLGYIPGTDLHVREFQNGTTVVYNPKEKGAYASNEPANSEALNELYKKYTKE